MRTVPTVNKKIKTQWLTRSLISSVELVKLMLWMILCIISKETRKKPFVISNAPDH